MSRGRVTRLRGSWLTAAALLVIGLADAPARANEEDATTTQRIGPIDVSIDGRARVRGGRAEGASVHAAWTPGIHLADRAGWDALAAFERSRFPEAPADGHRVVEQAPEPWMKNLQRPQLPIRWTRRLGQYLTYFKDDPKGQLLMRGWLRRAGRYEQALGDILAEHDVPRDLVFVALAESGFNPAVRSHVGAAGLWQFMEATGAVYGLRTSYWVDDRHDPVKSTHAAALYLADLKTRFGTWELALAAYNAGYGLVMTSIERTNSNDFWTLADIESGLPYATVNYVPKIVAAAFVGRNRAALGFGDDVVSPDAPLRWTEVRAPRSTKLERIAKLIDADAELVAELNAQLVRGRTPPGRGTYPIRIPRDRIDAFERAYGQLQAESEQTATYPVRHGDRLDDIATQHGLTTRELRALNGVRDTAEVRGGVVLVVPRVDQLVAAEPRDPPIAALPPLDPPAGKRRVYFETTRSTLPADLTRAFGATWSQVVAWNDLEPLARLQSGQVLQLFVDAGFDPVTAGAVVLGDDAVVAVVRGSREHLEASLGRRGLTRRGYTTRRGDTLAKVARKFDLSVGDVARINGFGRGHELEAGELLVVYVDERHARGTMLAPDPPIVYPVAIDRNASTPDATRVPVRTAPRATKRRAPDPGPTRTPSTADTNRRPGQDPP